MQDKAFLTLLMTHPEDCSTRAEWSSYPISYKGGIVTKYLRLTLCILYLGSECGGGSLGVGSPQARLSVTALAFRDEVVGTTSQAQTILLNNSGTGTLNIVKIAASVNFAETHTCGSALAFGGELLYQHNVLTQSYRRFDRHTFTDRQWGMPPAGGDVIWNR